jgi:hypothetical protein
MPRQRCGSLREELGLELRVTPAYTETTQFLHEGEMRDNVDFYFVARCAAVAPTMRGETAEEIAMMREIRWWSVAEIEVAEERVFPVDLAARVREFSG